MKGKFPILLSYVIFVYMFTRSTVELSSFFVGDSCETPDNETGVCKLLPQCEEIYLAVTRDKKGDGYRRCSFVKEDEVVCCPSPIKNRGGGRRPSQNACENYKSLTPLKHYILKGTAAGRNEFPHMAAIGKMDTQGETKYDCGGALIHPKYVLTAAHCVNGPIEHVRLGVIKLDDVDNKSDIKVERVFPHPDFKASSRHNDIALIKLDSWVGNYRPVCLSTYLPTFTADTELVGTGWGVIDTRTRRTSNELLKVTLRYFDRGECTESYKSEDNFQRLNPKGLLPSQLCAYDSEGGDTCQGDSGGPLHVISKGANGSMLELVGVVSYGSHCGTSIPGVYTNVPYFLDWIESIVWEDPKTKK